MPLQLIAGQRRESCSMNPDGIAMGAGDSIGKRVVSTAADDRVHRGHLCGSNLSSRCVALEQHCELLHGPIAEQELDAQVAHHWAHVRRNYARDVEFYGAFNDALVMRCWNLYRVVAAKAAVVEGCQDKRHCRGDGGRQYSAT